MPVVRLKGLKKVTYKRPDGTREIYWYAWVGGPRLDGEPGTPEFMAAYNRAVADRRAVPTTTLATLARLYKASPEFTGNAESTKAQWSRWLDQIGETSGDLDIGGLPIKALDDRRVRGDILEWRDQWAATPRKADYAIQVLSRLLSWSVDRGHLAINAAAGIQQLYASDRADQIWTPEELIAYRAASPSPEVAFIAPLACLTGLRREDLFTLAWSHVGKISIIKPTLKTRRRGGKAPRKNAIVPILPELRELLNEIEAQQNARHAELVANAARKNRPPPPRATTVLSSTRGTPWTINGGEHQVIDTKAKAGIDKHLHDGRGTFATRLRLAGLTASRIADVLGWEEERVERLLSTYVDRDAIILDIAAQIARSERSD